MSSSIESFVTELNAELEKARHAYYVLAAPIMPDAEYDAKEAQLKGAVNANPELAPLAPVLKAVGSDIADSPLTSVLRAAATDPAALDAAVDALPTVTSNGRIKHVRPMLSIENQYTKEDVVKFVLSLPTGSAVNIEPKRDGISCELCYIDGKLTQAVTRGTGTEGEDMTAQVKALNSIPNILFSDFLSMPSAFRIRGELVMQDGELDHINAEATAKGLKTYASTRNLTAGTMKQKDLSVVASREILFVPWDVYSPTDDNLLPDSNYERMQLLNVAGFPRYAGHKVASAGSPTADALSAGIIQVLDDVLAYNGSSDIRADGVVIKVDSHKLRKELGVASKFTNWMTCFKPQSVSGTTYLRKIIWQIGRQGALTPVAECDPVVLAGAVVTRASLNNETWIATMGLKVGAKVEMLRSGDVIPQIVKVLDDTGEDIVPPATCPECEKAITVWTDPKSNITSRFCENSGCPGRVRALFSYIGSRDVLEIDGLADDMATKIIKAKYARNIGELFEFQVEALDNLKKLQSKYGDEEGEEKFFALMAKQGFSVTILKMLRSMEKAKAAPWNKWIAAFGIPMVGRTLGKLLAKELKLEANDMPNLCIKLAVIASKSSTEGLGEAKSDVLLKWSLDPVNRAICEALYRAGVRPTPTVAKAAAGVGLPLAGMAFCISGGFDEDRETLIQKLESLGAVSKSSVSKSCTHFIVGEAVGSSKMKKFDDLVAAGVKIEKVGKDWLMKTLNESATV